MLADVLPGRRHRGGRVALQHAGAAHRLRISRPGSYYFSAGGGLGFGLAAALGVQLAQPDRPVVCVLGEGSAQYAVTGFWTAAAYGVPVTFLVLQQLRVLDPEVVRGHGAGGGRARAGPGGAGHRRPVAAAYGVPSRSVEGTEELREALTAGLASGAPNLVEVGVAPGMALL